MKSTWLGILALWMGLAGGIAGAAETFKIDPVHSSVLFRAGHYGIGYVWGRFNDLEGSFEVAEDSRALGAFQARVKAQSVDTEVLKRDEHLRSADFFDVATFPHITFRTLGVKEVNAGEFEALGELELHGVKREVRVTLHRKGEGKDPGGNHRYGLHGSLALKRSDYGMDKLLAAVEDEVLLQLAFEGIRQ